MVIRINERQLKENQYVYIGQTPLLEIDGHCVGSGRSGKSDSSGGGLHYYKLYLPMNLKSVSV